VFFAYDYFNERLLDYSTCSCRGYLILTLHSSSHFVVIFFQLYIACAWLGLHIQTKTKAEKSSLWKVQNRIMFCVFLFWWKTLWKWHKNINNNNNSMFVVFFYIQLVEVDFVSHFTNIVIISFGWERSWILEVYDEFTIYTKKQTFNLSEHPKKEQNKLSFLLRHADFSHQIYIFS
jgi:hypothetical protein